MTAAKRKPALQAVPPVRQRSRAQLEATVAELMPLDDLKHSARRALIAMQYFCSDTASDLPDEWREDFWYSTFSAIHEDLERDLGLGKDGD